MFYVPNNNFSYTQQVSASVPQKDPYYAYDDPGTFFLFLLE